MSRRSRWVLGSRAVAGLAAALATLGLAGCASARNDLGTSSGGCYVALPAALDAVHHHGRLHGVRLTSVTSLRRRAPALYRAARTGVPAEQQVCLVAFAGRFTASGVADPIGHSSGGLAVVELGYPDHRVMATLVTARPPFEFGHSHAFTP